ncbi:hypothetical protein [Hydrogenophaga sp.]|uniref:hypothetical protein n=1 Tax=Hydrogenophaga sp. TaxID=1904254 RepID=UPI00260D6863|nr:hypothetical protein [Hydrogenophaga sp.]MDM7949561.1 hypothetical protein [Hydrogenophaga sp.]
MHKSRWIGLSMTLVGVAALFVAPAQAQERVYRCEGKPVEYINNPEVAKTRGCKLMEGGNITIVQGTAPQAGTAPRASTAPRSTPTASRSANDRIDATAQRQRDSDARAILEAELRKAEERLTLARKEYANGEPEKQGIESRNYQRYLDRVAELKAAVGRAESDVEGIRRELGRLPGASSASAPAAQ